MASTFFQDYNQNNPIVSSWLNDINNGIYSPGGVPRVASLIPVAFVRFSVVGGVVTINQAVGVASVVRSSVGVFVITYAETLTNADNCYSINANVAGFTVYSAESAGSVTVTTSNALSAPTDPGSCCVVVLGAN